MDKTKTFHLGGKNPEKSQNSIECIGLVIFDFSHVEISRGGEVLLLAFVTCTRINASRVLTLLCVCPPDQERAPPPFVVENSILKHGTVIFHSQWLIELNDLFLHSPKFPYPSLFLWVSFCYREHSKFVFLVTCSW